MDPNEVEPFEFVISVEAHRDLARIASELENALNDLSDALGAFFATLGQAAAESLPQ